MLTTINLSILRTECKLKVLEIWYIKHCSSLKCLLHYNKIAVTYCLRCWAGLASALLKEGLDAENRSDYPQAKLRSRRDFQRSESEAIRVCGKRRRSNDVASCVGSVAGEVARGLVSVSVWSYKTCSQRQIREVRGNE